MTGSLMSRRCPSARSRQHVGAAGPFSRIWQFSARLQQCGISIVVVAMLLLSLSATVWAQDAKLPDFTGWVTDTTGTLDTATKTALSQELAALEKEKGAQIAVLMVPTTGNEAIESYATRAFSQWGIGRKNVDDGILLVIAKDDRTLRIEVGYGLEGAVPDVLAGRIIREQITPNFRAGQFSDGVLAGAHSLIALVQGEDLPTPVKGADSDDEGTPWMMLLVLLFLALLMPPGVPSLFMGVFAGIAFSSVMVGIGTAVVALMLGVLGRVLGIAKTSGPVTSSRRGGGGFGGGGGGGFSGGGGFGGGGGGSSGGGGASGSW